MVLTLMLGWYTCSVDFNQAFLMAELPNSMPTWLHLPRGFQSTAGEWTCLKLKKSAYGLCAVPKLWGEHLLKALLERSVHSKQL